MNKYHIFYDNDTIACTYQGKRINKFFKGDEVHEVLKRIGKDEYTKINITDLETIELKNKNREIKIDDGIQLYEEGYLYVFSKSLGKLLNAIHKYQNKKHGTKPVKIRPGIYVATASTIALLALAGALKDDTIKEEPIAITIENINEEPMEVPLTIESEKSDSVIDSNPIEIVEQMAEIEEEVSTPVVFMNYDQNIDTKKQDYAYENYYELVQKYSNKWGISPNLSMSVLTQESGGYNKNLMQIQFDSWKDMPITGYDFVNERKQTIVLTDTPERYNGKNYTVISRSDLDIPLTNISVGIFLLNYSIKCENYHISAGIQCYNYGVGNMEKLLNETSRVTGVSVDDILSDQTNTSFTDYTYVIHVGDPEYLSHVIRFNLDNEYYIQELTSDNDIIFHSIEIENTKGKRP